MNLKNYPALHESTIEQALIDNLQHFLLELVTKRYGKTVFEFLDFFLRVTIPFEFEIENNVTQDDTQGASIDNWIEEQIRKNPKTTTEELAKLSGKSVITIKRHITKLSHIKYVGSGYSGHWEIIK